MYNTYLKNNYLNQFLGHIRGLRIFNRYVIIAGSFRGIPQHTDS